MQIAFRDRLPAFSGLFFDDQGRILVRTYERAGGKPDSFSYDVFDQDGVYESKVAVPVTLDGNTVWKDGRVYTVENDENGLPLIKRHKIVWKRGAPASERGGRVSATKAPGMARRAKMKVFQRMARAGEPFTTVSPAATARPGNWGERKALIRP